MRLRRSRPAKWASTTRWCSSWTLNRPLGNFSKTVPVTSMLSSLLINLQEVEWGRDPKAATPAGTQPPPAPGSGSIRSHVGRLQSFRSLRDFELYFTTLLQAAVALGLDGGEMHEHVFSVLPLDEAITLGCVEPLPCAFFF